MHQLLTFNEAVSAAFGLWLGWKLIRGAIRLAWEQVLFYRWKRRMPRG